MKQNEAVAGASVPFAVPTEATELPATFDYVNLSEIDPSFKPVDEGMYNLQVLKLEKRTFDKKDGTEGQYLKFHLAITDSDRFTGRRFWPTLFFGDRELRILRKLSDVMGLPQLPGQPFDEWVKSVNEAQPAFRTKIDVLPSDERGYPINPKSKNPPAMKLDANGNPVPVNSVDWNSAMPAV